MPALPKLTTEVLNTAMRSCSSRVGAAAALLLLRQALPAFYDVLQTFRMLLRAALLIVAATAVAAAALMAMI